jgi:hypothetical protein
MRASILAATLMLVGCNSSGPANDSKTSVPGSAAREPAAVPEIPPYVLDGLTAWRERNPAPPSALDQQLPISPLLRQNWMNCDGFLTSNSSAGFCEQTPPATWRPFQFEGKPYFFIPLSG